MNTRTVHRLSKVARAGTPRFVRTTNHGITRYFASASVMSISSKSQDAIKSSMTSIAVSENPKIQTLQRSVHSQLPPTMQLMSLVGKVIMITGGARGLGHSMAGACIEAGAKEIIILDTNQKLGEEAAEKLHEATSKTVPVSYYNVDVRDEQVINRAIDTLIEKSGIPDVLINSAGIADSNMPAETYDSKKFIQLIDINLNGSFFMARALAKKLIAAEKPGSIIFIASMSGSVVNYPQEQSCYNASKAGVVMLGKSLAAEWAKHGIRVNMISPGYMDTALNNVPALDAQKKIWKSLTPQGRLGAVNDLNGLAVLLASDASAFMTGSNVVIDGGYTLY